MESARGKDEDILEYQIRIFENRESLNLSWNDVAALINEQTGHDYSADKYRKFWMPFKQGVEYAKLSAIEHSMADEIAVLEKKKQEIFKEKVRLQDQKRELNSRLRIEARQEHIVDTIKVCINDLEKSKPLTAIADNSVVNEDRQGALLLGDWHKGLFADNYWNEFNDEEFNRRVERLVKKTIEYGKLNEVGILHVFILGDMVNGLIHVSTRILSTENVVQQTTKVSEKLAEVLSSLSEHFRIVKVYNIKGNHDRITAKKDEEISEESFSEIIEWYLRARLSKNGNILFKNNDYDSEIANAYIFDETIFAVHGHRDRPSDVVQNLSLLTKLIPDYIFMGHYHHSEEKEINGTELIVNSSLCGVDSYAKDIRKASPPAQKFIVFDRYEGRLCTYNIRLDKK